MGHYANREDASREIDLNSRDSNEIKIIELVPLPESDYFTNEVLYASEHESEPEAESEGSYEEHSEPEAEHEMSWMEELEQELHHNNEGTTEVDEVMTTTEQAISESETHFIEEGHTELPLVPSVFEQIFDEEQYENQEEERPQRFYELENFPDGEPIIDIVA